MNINEIKCPFCGNDKFALFTKDNGQTQNYGLSTVTNENGSIGVELGTFLPLIGRICTKCNYVAFFRQEP